MANNILQVMRYYEDWMLIQVEGGFIVADPKQDANASRMISEFVRGGGSVNEQFTPVEGIVPKWNHSAEYVIGDIVYHDNEYWIATSNNKANMPDRIPGDWDIYTLGASR